MSKRVDVWMFQQLLLLEEFQILQKEGDFFVGTTFCTVSSRLELSLIILSHQLA